MEYCLFVQTCRNRDKTNTYKKKQNNYSQSFLPETYHCPDKAFENAMFYYTSIYLPV